MQSDWTRNAHLRHSIQLAMYGAPAMRLTPHIRAAAPKKTAYLMRAKKKARPVFCFPEKTEACIVGQHTSEK